LFALVDVIPHSAALVARLDSQRNILDSEPPGRKVLEGVRNADDGLQAVALLAAGNAVVVVLDRGIRFKRKNLGDLIEGKSRPVGDLRKQRPILVSEGDVGRGGESGRLVGVERVVDQLFEDVEMPVAPALTSVIFSKPRFSR
jgi:hypothetical protein